MFTVTTPSVTSPAPTVGAPTPIPERVGRAREKCKDTREEREKRGGFLDRFGEHFSFFFLRVVLKVTSSVMKRETRIDSEILNAKEVRRNVWLILSHLYDAFGCVCDSFKKMWCL